MKNLYLRSFSYLLAVLCIAMSITATAQSPIDTIVGCDEIPWTPQQAGGCTICTFESLYGTTQGFTPSAEAGWCGTIENDQYIGFVSGATGAVVFEISTFNCWIGDGIQVGIYDQNNQLVGDCFNQVFPNEPQIFTSAGLTPGETYFIRIDGFAGDECEFVITVISGLSSGAPTQAITVEGPVQTCVDVETTYRIEPQGAADAYRWEVQTGSHLGEVSIDGSLLDSAYSTRSSTSYLSFDGATASLAPGECDTARITVTPTSFCSDPGNPYSLTINVCRSLTPPDTLDVLKTYPACSSAYYDTLSGRAFAQGVYLLPTLDANGDIDCSQIIRLTVEPASDRLQVEVTGNNYICGAQSSLTASVTGGVPPYTYVWLYNGQPISTQGSVDSVLTGYTEPGRYQVRVSDGSGCRRLSSSKLVLLASDIGANLIVNIQPADCDSLGGSIAINATYNDLFDIEWSSGDTETTFVDDLPFGNYLLSLSEPGGGCVFDTLLRVPLANTCYAQITGSILGDQTIDCANPTGFNLSDVRVFLDNGESTFTDASGNYTFYVEPGTYTVLIDPNVILPAVLVCTPSYQVTISQLQDVSSGNDFHFENFSGYDVELTKLMRRPSVGRVSTTSIIVRNNGYLPISPTVYFEHTANQTFENSHPPGQYDSLSRTLAVAVGTLAPGRFDEIYIYMLTSTTAQIGDTVIQTASLDSLTAALDTSPLDNSVTCQDTVVAAYDPNDKQVIPSGTGPDGIIETSDSLLQYTIRFENTGGDDALYVRLEDQLSPQLDLSTLRPLGGSHPYTVRVDDGGYMQVEFTDIVLRPVREDSLNAQGYFSYSIRQRPGLQPGDRIENTAEIYFDFNDPIVTNTTVNTIARPVGTRTPRLRRGGLVVFPNPSQGTVTLQLDDANTSMVQVELVGVDGRLLERIAPSGTGNRVTLAFGDSQTLVDGLYTVVVTLEDGTRLRERLIIQTGR